MVQSTDMSRATDSAEDGPVEHTLLIVREVNVHQIPKRLSSGGYKCAEWLVSSKIWSGRLRVVAIGDMAEIRLEDPNTGELFVACHVEPGRREVAVEPASDSSRYFVLRVDDGRGRHAFLGLGFNDRNAAFDFNVALQDHERHVLAKKNPQVVEDVNESADTPTQPKVDMRLKVRVVYRYIQFTCQDDYVSTWRIEESMLYGTLKRCDERN